MENINFYIDNGKRKMFVKTSQFSIKKYFFKYFWIYTAFSWRWKSSYRLWNTPRSNKTNCFSIKKTKFTALKKEFCFKFSQNRNKREFFFSKVKINHKKNKLTKLKKTNIFFSFKKNICFSKSIKFNVKNNENNQTACFPIKKNYYYRWKWCTCRFW